MMTFKNLAVAAIAVLTLAGSADAGSDIIENLDIRGTGVFGFQPGDPFATPHTMNTNGTEAFNGGAFPGGARTPNDPIEVSLTYSNLDLDGDDSANDSVTFTLQWTKVDLDGDGLDGGDLASFGQGMDTGFGNLNDVQVSVTSVSGTATDSGDSIVFDGFTGATIGAGTSGGDIDVSVEINGAVTSIVEADPGGGFYFRTNLIDFSPTATLTFDNSMQNGAGPNTPSIVARAYDLQFSTSAGILGDADFDLDVDGQDFLVLQRDDPAGIGAWEAAYPASLSGISAVPEPSTLTLLCVSFFGMLGRPARS